MIKPNEKLFKFGLVFLKIGIGVANEIHVLHDFFNLALYGLTLYITNQLDLMNIFYYL